jgi:hypothetical protein
VARRTIADEIKLYGTLLGLSEAECERMARGGSRQARIACMRDLRHRYRRENQVPEGATRNGAEQLDFWRERLEAQRCIYFVQQGSWGPVKIGIANDPLARRSKLQTGNPQELHLRHVVPGDRALLLGRNGILGGRSAPEVVRSPTGDAGRSRKRPAEAGT